MPFTPGERPRSTSSVEKPLRASVSAAEEPAGPAPTTMASKRSTVSRFPLRKSGTGKSLSAKFREDPSAATRTRNDPDLVRHRRSPHTARRAPEAPAESRQPFRQEIGQPVLSP